MSNVILQNYVEFLYLSTPVIPAFGITVLIISTTKKNNFTCTIYSQYIAVIYDTMYDKTSVRFALTNDTLTGELWGECLL